MKQYPVYSRLWSLLLVVAILTAWAGCDDELDPIADTLLEDVCGIIDCDGDPDVAEVVEDNGPPPKEVVDADQCDLAWSYTRPEGGIPSHPLVSDGNLNTIVAGSTLRRLTEAGAEAEICTAPFVLAGEQLGTPSQGTDQRFWMGTASGQLVRVNKKCEQIDEVIDIEQACVTAKNCNTNIEDGVPHAVREAPAHGGDKIYVLDDQPVLHRFTSAGDYDGSFISTDSSRRGATAVYVAPQGEGEPFVAFPTTRSVIAVKAANHAQLWKWDPFVEQVEPAREVTTPLAVTSGGRLLFVGATVAGDTHKDHMLYRLSPVG
ncbi:MAG: hypothetical protein ACI9WU_005344, partial [Myxococcota bacterium]